LKTQRKTKRSQKNKFVNVSPYLNRYWNRQINRDVKIGVCITQNYLGNTNEVKRKIQKLFEKNYKNLPTIILSPIFLVFHFTAFLFSSYCWVTQLVPKNLDHLFFFQKLIVSKNERNSQMQNINFPTSDVYLYLHGSFGAHLTINQVDLFNETDHF
jgi:hypothetical protein